MKNNVKIENQPEKLTKRDVRKSWFLWWLFGDLSNSYEQMQTVAFCASMAPILQKLYKTKESLSEALKRHLNFFNTEAIWGSSIHGITIALEEQKAHEQNIPGEAITAIKTGLMGPLAGIGDTIDWGILLPVTTGIFLPLAAAGSPWAAIGLLFVFVPLTVAEGLYFHKQGYKFGRDAITRMMEGGRIQQLIDGASVLGLFMMGALAANFVDLQLALEIQTKGGDPVIFQELLDSIAPGILPLAILLGTCVFFSKRKQNTVQVLLLILVISLVGSFIGLF